jgi:pimeloyl-ACP methyl ester carboxylesterase
MFDSDIKRAMIKVNGINLFIRDTESDKPVMLCLHGRWGRGETWIDLINRYKDNYRIIAPDQRGHGLSDRPVARYSADVFAKDCAELLQQLNCESAIVVGHSMGGRMAAHFTYLYPEMVKALAILDETASGPEIKSDLAPDQVHIDDGLTAEWPTPYSSYEEALCHLKSTFDRETNVRYFLESLTETAEGYYYLFSRYAMSAIGEYSKVWFKILPKINCPVLLIRAANSWCLPKEDADKMKDLIKDCTYFEVSDSDHMVYADNPDEFYPQFDEFLKKIS